MRTCRRFVLERNRSWRFEQCQYMCLVFCFPVWICPYPLALVSALQVLLALAHLTAGMWIPVVCGPCWAAVSLFHWVAQAVAVSAAARRCHTEHTGYLLLYNQCSPNFGVSFQLCCSSCTHRRAGAAAKGWGLDFSLLIVSEFSVDDKTSSLTPVTFVSVPL